MSFPTHSTLPETLTADLPFTHDESHREHLNSSGAGFESFAGTAVETFARRHGTAEQPAQAKYYRDLLPLARPQPGEQYAFEVDLDACTGCKACVTACHNLNGLEDDELWRQVGLLHGGTSQLPIVQHVTTACHHCIDPACLDGCPVLAYEKDPATGIVRHLDDQCIGCQYCILKCPYDVPKFSANKGIVRKCDMCHGRLAVGEAPACVQACPNQAIRIVLQNQAELVEQSETNLFLPGAHEPGYTLPTTVYKTKRAFPRNVLPADFYSVTPGHQHTSLVWMLVLTQMSVGAFLLERLLPRVDGGAIADSSGKLRLAQVACALGAAVLGSLAAVFHLGRPLYAFRAVLGLRTSWLSREILAFGLFTAVGSAYALLAGWNWFNETSAGVWEPILGDAAAACGIVGVLCSMMIYADTRRPFWSEGVTTAKFALTALVLGAQATLLTLISGAIVSGEFATADLLRTPGQWLCQVMVWGMLAKLAYELAVLRHLADRQMTALKRSAVLLTGELKPLLVRRVLLAVIGGGLLPLILRNGGNLSAGWAFTFCVAAFVVTFAGEILERSLFFQAAVAPKMPGAVLS